MQGRNTCRDTHRVRAARRMDAPTAGGEGRRRRGASDPEVVAQAKLEVLTLKEQIKRIKDEKNDVSRAYRPLPRHHSRSPILTSS